MSNMRSQRARMVLIAVLVIELIAGAALLYWMIPTFPKSGESQGQGSLVPLWVSLLLSLVIWWVWLAAMLAGAIRRKGNWVRASAITSHVLLFAAGVGIVQGIFSTVWVGVGLIVLAIAGFVSASLMRGGSRAEGAEGADVAAS